MYGCTVRAITVQKCRIGKGNEKANRCEIDSSSGELREDRIFVRVLHALELASGEIHAVQTKQSLHYQRDARKRCTRNRFLQSMRRAVEQSEKMESNEHTIRERRFGEAVSARHRYSIRRKRAECNACTRVLRANEATSNDQEDEDEAEAECECEKQTCSWKSTSACIVRRSELDAGHPALNRLHQRRAAGATCITLNTYPYIRKRTNTNTLQESER